MSTYFITLLMLLWIGLSPLKAQSIVFNQAYDYDGGSGTGISLIKEDSGYVVIGSGWVTEHGGWHGTYLLKTDQKGQSRHFSVYGVEELSYWAGKPGSAVKDAEGNFIIVGVLSDTITSSSTNGFVFKLGANGDSIWTKSYGGSEWDGFYDCILLADSGYIVLGNTGSFGVGSQQFWLVRLDKQGNELWDKTYGTIFYEEASQIVQTPDNGFMMAGFKDGLGGISDPWVIRTDSVGGVIWEKSFGTERDDCAANFIQPTSDGSYLIGGCIDTVIINGDYNGVAYVAKINIDGKMLWRTFFTGRDRIGINQSIELSDGSIAAAGYIIENNNGTPLGWVSRLRAGGEIVWKKEYFALPDRVSEFKDILATKDGGMVLTGTARDTAGEQSIWIVKLDSMGNTCQYGNGGCDSVTYPVGIPAKASTPPAIHLYPNPTNGQLFLQVNGTEPHQADRFVLLDITGRLQRTIPISPNPINTIDLHDLPNGLYLYEIRKEGAVLQTGKVSLVE